jgi:hypothetical protein
VCSRSCAISVPDERGTSMTQLSTTGLLPRGGLRMTPARRLTLAFGVPVVLALIAWTGFNIVTLVGHTSFGVSYAVPVQGGQVNVGLNGSNVTVSQVPGAAARLTGTVEYTLFRPSLSMSTVAGTDQLNLSCGISVGNCGMNTALDVPARTAVTLSTGGGDASISGFDVPVTMNLQGGNLEASDLKGNLHVDTGGGDVAGSGMAGSLAATTEGGNIAEIAVTAPTVNVESGGGDVTLTFTQVPTNLQITAEGGNITVILPPGAAKYNILTPGTDGGNASYPDSLVSSSSHNVISVNSGGGDISIGQS